MFEILVDKYNKAGKHSEEEDLKKCGYKLTKVCLPVGDYCAKTNKLEEMLEIYRNEEYTQRRYHDDYSKSILSKLDFEGTYTIAVDVKLSFNELEKNLLLSKKGNRYRFERELLRAKNLGIKLITIIADDDYRTFEELEYFQRDGSGRSCGEAMKRRMAELMRKYGCEFYLVSRDKLAQAIIYWLSQEPLLKSSYNQNVFQVAN